MKKVLFINFNSIWGPHFETDLEIMLNLKNDGCEIFSLSCGGCFNASCISNVGNNPKYCRRCLKTLSNGLDLIKLDDAHRLKIDKHYEITSQKFNSISELVDFKFESANIGLGVASSIMSITRDYNFSIKDNQTKIHALLNTSYTVYKALEKYNSIYHFDEIYMFNGRFAEYYSAIEFCKLSHIDFYLHERASSIYKYLVVKNKLFHSNDTFLALINHDWNTDDNFIQKTQIANDWFKERRDGVEQSWLSFVENQESNRLPDNFDRNKENIVIFNSSLDESACFKEWANPIEPNENLLFENIVRHYENDKNKHFYLRIHPNLKGVNTSQMKEIIKLRNKNYTNLTIIMPENSIDTYAMMDACDKTIVSISTTGIESTYWGNVSIVCGKASYVSYDCAYVAETYEELFDLIDAKNLLSKPKENTFPYAYWSATHGTKFKYFEPNGLFHGKFLGVDLKKKPWHVKLRLALQKRFKK